MANQTKPKWLPLKGASTHSGLSIRLLQDYVRDGLVVSANVLKPGSRRGRRLIEVESLDAFIRAGIGGKTNLAMNASRRSNSNPSAE